MSEPRRVGILGGTFDPVHLGHLVVASEIHDALGLDEVVLVPTGRPWQKSERTVTDAVDRVAMAELAVLGDDRLRVSTVDVDRPGPTYSVDTVTDLRDEYGADVALYFVVGADALAGLAGWHKADALLREVVVVGCTRGGDAPAVPAAMPADRFVFVATTAIGVSSTLVRERVRQGASIRYLVPDAVERYVHDRKLYRDAA